MDHHGRHPGHFDGHVTAVSNTESRSIIDGDDLLIGTQLDDFEILRLIGRGGMARVYEARDVRLERPVALKVMSAELIDDDELRARFFREARAVANLDHPNIVSVYRFGEGPRLYYIAMKFLDGRTLLNVLKQRRQQGTPLEPEKVVRIVSDLGAALDYAHMRGVIHRDIKPSNIMLTTDGRAVLMDFGLMLELNSESTLGTAFGTPRYISPEQAIASHRAVPQSDIYSLGVVLYEMVTLQAPFDSGSPMNMALDHINNPPPPPRSLRADLPPAVETVMLKALEKQPEDRWQTGAEFADALKAAFEAPVKEGDVTSRTPIGLVGVAASPAPSPPQRSGADDPGEQTQPLPGTLRQREPLLARLLRGEFLFIGAVAVVLICLGALALASVVPRFSAISLGAAPESPLPQSNVRLIYSPDMFTVYNAGGHSLSLAGISFARPDRSDRFRAGLWGEYAHTNVLPGGCLVIDPIDNRDDVLPDVCGGQASRYETPAEPGGRFWIARSPDTTFVVLSGEALIQTCSTQTNFCQFALP